MNNKTSFPRWFILIVGISGAGKSTVQNILGDLGFYAIGILPVSLCRPLIQDALKRSATSEVRLAVQPDIDSRAEQSEAQTVLKELRDGGWQVRIVFLDCSTEVLLKRYSETRRPHPGFDSVKDRNLEDTIQRERERLAPLKEIADYRIDTTTTSVHDLKRQLKDFIDSLAVRKVHRLRLNFMSFGFKYGLPRDCDLLVDVRFLPNPYFIEGMRDRTGLDEDVCQFVLSQKATGEFISRYTELLDFLMPHYIHEGKAYLNVGIGCTGGKHRSVAIAEEMAKRVHQGDYLISVVHRDNHLWNKKRDRNRAL